VGFSVIQVRIAALLGNLLMWGHVAWERKELQKFQVIHRIHISQRRDMGDAHIA
jgi:hypothetical protein